MLNLDSLTKIVVGENYLGKVIAHITLRKAPAQQLFFDFRGVSIGNLTVNGTQAKEEGAFRNHKIYIPTSLLKIGDD